MIQLFGKSRVNVLKIKPLAQHQPHKGFLEEKPELNNERAHFERVSHLRSVVTAIH